jgi:hypothetical protein
LNNLPIASDYDVQEVVKNKQPQLMEIRDIVHAAKLLRLLKAKELLVGSQLEFVRNYLKENA